MNAYSHKHTLMNICISHCKDSSTLLSLQSCSHTLTRTHTQKHTLRNTSRLAMSLPSTPAESPSLSNTHIFSPPPPLSLSQAHTQTLFYITFSKHHTKPPPPCTFPSHLCLLKHSPACSQPQKESIPQTSWWLWLSKTGWYGRGALLCWWLQPSAASLHQRLAKGQQVCCDWV